MSGTDGTAGSKDTREVIMEATFNVRSGYGDKCLRIRAIGEEVALSRPLIHPHFDGKYDLLSSFLEYAIDQYEGSVEGGPDVDPRTELDARIGQYLFGPGFDEFTH